MANIRESTALRSQVRAQAESVVADLDELDALPAAAQLDARALESSIRTAAADLHRLMKAWSLARGDN